MQQDTPQSPLFDWKHILMSIFIGAVVAFLSTLFQALADFLKTHASDIIGGVSATAVYLSKRT